MVLTCVADAKSGNLYAGPTKGSEFAVVSTCLFYLDVVRATYLNSSSKLLVEAEISAKVWRQIDGPIDLARTECNSNVVHGMVHIFSSVTHDVHKVSIVRMYKILIDFIAAGTHGWQFVHCTICCEAHMDLSGIGYVHLGK
jgi:hypothetical protein